MISETEFQEILKKYDFVLSYGDGVFGFYPDESSYHFCKIGSYTYNLCPVCLKIRVFNAIKFKHEKFVGCSEKSTLCENIEDLEKCLQNIAAQRKKLLVDEKIKKINKLFK